MAKKHSVTLTESERALLRRRISAGSLRASTQTQARILLKADEGPGGPGWTDQAVATALEVSVPTVERVRKRFAEEGLEAALRPEATAGLPRRSLEAAPGRCAPTHESRTRAPATDRL